jgi:hypothetical protein
MLAVLTLKGSSCLRHFYHIWQAVPRVYDSGWKILAYSHDCLLGTKLLVPAAILVVRLLAACSNHCSLNCLSIRILCMRHISASGILSARLGISSLANLFMIVGALQA